MPGTLPKFRIAELQEGGSGANNWIPLYINQDVGSIKMTGPDGGEVEIKQHYGRDYNSGNIQIINQVVSGQKKPYTFDLNLPFEMRQVLTKFKGLKNIRLRMFTGDYSNPTNYQKMLLFTNGLSTKDLGKFDSDLVDDNENKGEQLRRTYPHSFAYAYEIDPLGISDISGMGSAFAFALNDIISVGYERWTGDVSGEDTNNSGDKEYLAISAVDGSTFHHVFWTADRFATVVNNVGATANFIGQGIAKAGSNVVIAGSGAGGGLMYASFDSVKAGTATWTRSTNISAGTVVNAVVAVSASVLYACGASGAIYKSTDSGLSFTSLGTAVTANSLTKLAVADDQLIWAGGASGTLVKIYKDVMSVVAVNGLSTTAINALRVPPGPRRGCQLFIGSAAGNIHYTANSIPSSGAPLFVARTFDQSGVGAIDGIRFAGYEGEIMYVIQTNGSSQSRLLRDFSGGKMAGDVEILGSFTSPTNATYNALAVPAPVAGMNCVVVVGDVSTVAKAVLYN